MAFELIKDLWGFMKERKKWWLLPFVIVMVIVGAFIIFTQSSAISSFIYILF